MGRQWYEDGKLMKKMNTFTDFIAVSEFLIENKYTSPKHLYITGGSAGGLLIGAVGMSETISFSFTHSISFSC